MLTDNPQRPSEKGGATAIATVTATATVELARGTTVGRYLVISLVGKGGMGEVYAAYDPELDRKIALKLLRAPGTAGTDSSDGRARLLREAQAIARLSDPNVVVVYDVGTFDERVFLAMEFVDGNTLAYWAQAKSRSWREIIATFAAAGRGLAAAHRAGVVHRDFKPENVMIGRDGKVRVMDFGLARAIHSDGEEDAASLASSAGTTRRTTAERKRTGATPVAPIDVQSPGEKSLAPAARSPITPGVSPTAGTANVSGEAAGPSGGWTADDTATRDLAREPSPASVTVSPSALDVSLTITGAIMGTPAYMAPEQFQRGVIDARTDQFSFCTSLYEALYGERPFTGKSLHDLSANVIAGQVRPAPAHARVPGWLRRVILRGLRVDRSERHASMEALIEAMTRDPARGRRRWAATLTATAVVVVLSVGMVRAQRQQSMRCLGADARLAGIWELPTVKGTSPRKQAVRQAFLRTGKRYAADSFTLVMSALDRYVTEWNDMHREACEATNLRGEQSAEVLDLRMSCLNDRFSEVRALTNVFNDANGEVVTQSASAVQSLRPVEQCADIVALRAVVRPPDDPAVRRAVAEVRMQLADVKALASAGRYKSGADAIPPVVAAARATAYAPVIAEALLQLGELELLKGETARAEVSLEEALWIAESSHHDEVVVEAADYLIANLGYYQNRHAEAQRWGRFAEAVLKRLGPGHEILAAWRENNLSMDYAAQGRTEEALAMSRKALETKTRALGGAHFDVALSMLNVAVTLQELGRVDEAIVTNERTLDILRSTVGVEHPLFGTAIANQAEFLEARGRYGEAEKTALQALDIAERELSPEHPLIAFALTALGRIRVGLGRPEDAIQALERALKLRLANSAPPSQVAEAKFVLAQSLGDSHQSLERAFALAEQARDELRKEPGPAKQLPAVEQWLEAHQPFRRLSMR